MIAAEIPYVAGRIARRLMPESLARRYFTNDFDDLRHLIGIHEEQLAAVEHAGGDVSGEVVLEVGPGRYNPAAAGFLGQDAQRVVFVEHARRTLDLSFLAQRLTDLLSAFGYSGSQWHDLLVPDPEESPQQSTFGGGRLEFRWQDAAATGLPDSSVGAIFSHAVLQCLAEPEAVLAELARVLKPGGFMFHLVDLRDHYFDYPLQFLHYSEHTWSHVLTSRYPHKAYLNRLRLPQIASILEDLGLEVETRPLLEDVGLARQMRPRLHPDFQQFTDEELAPLLAEVYAWK